jgi:ribonucleoside-diphosphate reductase alpha chain
MTLEGAPLPEGRASTGLRLRQPLRQEGQAVPVGRQPHPHDGRGPAFISGAISKTINMPNDATVEDCQKAYAVLVAGAEGQRALPRRLQAQPAARRRPVEDDEDEDDGCWKSRRRQKAQFSAEKIVEKVVVEEVIKARAREAAERRKGYTQKAIVGGHKVYLRTGEYEDGRSARSSSTCTRKARASAR